MNRISIAALALSAGFSLAENPPAPVPSHAALAAAERVEGRGVVERLDLLPGHGLSGMLVKTAQGSTRVQLGSMRFLIERNFNPKAGADVVVKGFRLGEDLVVARTVDLPESRQTIVLRSEDGTPVWRMARYGKKGR